MLTVQWQPRFNPLTTPPSYRPAVVPRGKVGYDELAARIARRNPLFNESMGKSYMLEMRAEIAQLLAEGYLLSLEGLFSAQVWLNGRLTSVDSPLPPLEKSLRVRMQASKKLVETVLHMTQTERLPVTEKLPVIAAAEDALLQLPDVLNPDGMLRIKGEDLYFNQAAENCGCFLAGTRSGLMRQSRCGQIANSEILLLPDIPSQPDPWNNEYQLSVVTQYTENGTLRTGLCRRMLRTPLAVTIGAGSGILSGGGTSAFVLVSDGTLISERARVRIQVILDVQDKDLSLNLIDMTDGGEEGPKIEVNSNGVYTLAGWSGSDLTSLEIIVNDYDGLLKMVRSPYGGRLVDILDVTAGT
ncbi:hypothetical protein [Candidatus Electronema sp. TJ]|uniref:hypothetical protein n=1 Tax=Candidatus Electronema sp. TJ TaxID=3401573 RepID=UPI003AA81F7D